MSYDTDLSDKEWDLVRIYFEKRTTNSGSKNKYIIREVVNAIFYVLKTGCRWQDIPKEKPPCATVFYHYKKWRDNGTFDKANENLLKNIQKK